MTRVLTAIALVFATALPALACPNYSYPATNTHTYRADQLTHGREFDHVAGGHANLANCGHAIGGTVAGYVSTEPNYRFTLLGADHYSVYFEAHARCDTILLINAPNGTWYYDDDSAGGHDPRIRLRGSANVNGAIDVWIGSYGTDVCPAELELYTRR